MTATQRAFAMLATLAIFLVVLELVRRRKLREEYSLLWIATSVVMLILSTWYGLIEWITRAIGAITVTTTLFIFALLFLLAISVHFTTVISRLTVQVRRLTQEVAILQARSPSPPAPRDGSPGDEQPS
jgi:hypothetical protein